MKRSAGVTFIAILSMIGSVLVLLIGILLIVVMALFPPPPSNPQIPAPFFKVLILFGALVYIGPSIWGILTSVGLFRLRKWARISILVFSILLILMAVPSGLISFLIPTPEVKGADPGFFPVFRILMAGFWLMLAAIGTWWLIFFTRSGVKAQFEPSAVLSPLQAIPGTIPVPVVPSLPDKPRRPVSFTVIACLMLLGALFMPIAFLMHTPGIVLTRIVTGPKAVVYYIAVTVLSLYVGIGLLRLRPLARKVGIVYSILLLINSAVFYLAPGGVGRMRSLIESQSTIFPWMRLTQSQPNLQLDMAPAMIVGGITGLLIISAQIYFLITGKEAFEAAARAR